jgi:hypothetical protein
MEGKIAVKKAVKRAAFKEGSSYFYRYSHSKLHLA